MRSAQKIQPLDLPPDAEIPIPGSKSHTNRALVCAALAHGESNLSGVLLADDTEAMLGAVEAIGAEISVDRNRRTVTVFGVDDTRRPAPGRKIPVDVRQSGTTGRFLLPVLAASPGHWVLDGDAQLRARPFGPQLEALRSLGAEIVGQALPLEVTGRRLTAAPVDVAATISSQFLSGLLLAAPLMDGAVTIGVDGDLVSKPYVELTLATMAGFGVEVERGETDAGASYRVPDVDYRPSTMAIEPDASAASYFFAAAAITGGKVRVNGLGTATVQGDLRFVDLLAKMGARVEITPNWTEVEGTGVLRGIDADLSDISDTAQTLAVAATFANSPTEMTGIGFIRHKETDRIAAVVTELNRRGIAARATDDGMVIEPGVPEPGPVSTYDDHRMAMSFSLLGLKHSGIEIEDPGCVAKTFPRFFEVLEQLRRT